MPTAPVTWLDQITVNPSLPGQQEGASITQLANGNILVSWEQQDQAGAASPPGSDIMGRVFNPLGQPITGEFRLNNAATADDETDATVAALPGGGFVVAYRVVHEGRYSDLRIEEYTASGAQVSESSLIRSDTDASRPNYGAPHIAVSPAGAVLVTWLRSNIDGTLSVEARLYDPATNAASAFVTVASARIDEAPAVAALANGGFVVASVSAANTITHTRMNADGSVGASATIATGGRDVADPTVTALAGGGFVIAWTGTGTDQTPRTFFHGITPTAMFSGTAGPGYDAKITALPDGGFVIVHIDDAANAIEAARYAATGTFVGTQAFATFGLSCDVVTLADGRLAVAWQGQEIAMEILDTRDLVGTTLQGGWQIGTARADTFTSATQAHDVAAWDGDDTVRDGGAVNTRFQMGNGNDRMIVTSALDADHFLGGAGIDWIDWSRVAATGLTFHMAHGHATGDGRVERMTSFENLTATQNRDTVVGTQEANAIDGLAGDDVLQGRGSNDTLRGGDGNDVITGGDGRDRMAGGAGADDFVFTRIADSRPGILRDAIVDFVRGVDDIVLTGIDANAGLAGHQPIVLDAGGTFAAGELRQTRMGADMLIALNTDSDAAAEMTILLLGITAPLTAGDLLL